MLLMFEPKIMMPEGGGQEVNCYAFCYPEPNSTQHIICIQ